jgi:hypothetical protein
LGFAHEGLDGGVSGYDTDISGNSQFLGVVEMTIKRMMVKCETCGRVTPWTYRVKNNPESLVFESEFEAVRKALEFYERVGCLNCRGKNFTIQGKPETPVVEMSPEKMNPVASCKESTIKCGECLEEACLLRGFVPNPDTLPSEVEITGGGVTPPIVTEQKPGRWWDPEWVAEKREEWRDKVAIRLEQAIPPVERVVPMEEGDGNPTRTVRVGVDLGVEEGSKTVVEEFHTEKEPKTLAEAWESMGEQRIKDPTPDQFKTAYDSAVKAAMALPKNPDERQMAVKKISERLEQAREDALRVKTMLSLTPCEVWPLPNPRTMEEILADERYFRIEAEQKLRGFRTPVLKPCPRWKRVWWVVKEYFQTLGRALAGRKVEEWEE